MSIYTINILSTLACIYLGMMSLNLSMDKPFKQIFNKNITLNQVRLLRIIGWIFLTLSMIAAIAAWNVSIGIAAWFGIATFMVGLLIYTQAYRPNLAWKSMIALFIMVICLQIFRLL